MRRPPATPLLTGLLLAAIPTLYTGLTAGLADDPLLRTWLAGGLIPGRMLAEPWRLVTAPLLHLDRAHLIVNGALLMILGAAGAIRLGPLRAGLIALGAAWVGGVASALHARGWAVGASGAVFGLLGALVVDLGRTHRHCAVWLGLLAGSLLWAVPADRAAHLGGLLAGAALSLARPGPSATRRAALACAGLALAGLVGGGWHLARSDDPPAAWAADAGLTAPAGWSPGVPIPPCRVARTNGPATLCVADRPPAPLPGVEAHPLPGGRHLLTHAVSPAARRHHRALFAEARARNGGSVNRPRPAPSPAARP